MIIECTNKNLKHIVQLIDQGFVRRLLIRKHEEEFLIDLLQAPCVQDETPFHHFSALECLQNFQKMFELNLVEDFSFYYEIGKGAPVFSYSYKKDATQLDEMDIFKQLQSHLIACFDLINQIENKEKYLVEDLFQKPKTYNRYRPVSIEQSIQLIQEGVGKHVKQKTK